MLLMLFRYRLGGARCPSSRINPNQVTVHIYTYKNQVQHKHTVCVCCDSVYWLCQLKKKKLCFWLTLEDAFASKEADDKGNRPERDADPYGRKQFMNGVGHEERRRSRCQSRVEHFTSHAHSAQHPRNV